MHGWQKVVDHNHSRLAVEEKPHNEEALVAHILRYENILQVFLSQGHHREGRQQPAVTQVALKIATAATSAQNTVKVWHQQKERSTHLHNIVGIERNLVQRHGIPFRQIRSSSPSDIGCSRDQTLLWRFRNRRHRCRKSLGKQSPEKKEKSAGQAAPYFTHTYTYIYKFVQSPRMACPL